MGGINTSLRVSNRPMSDKMTTPCPRIFQKDFKSAAQVGLDLTCLVSPTTACEAKHSYSPDPHSLSRREEEEAYSMCVRTHARTYLLDEL